MSDLDHVLDWLQMTMVVLKKDLCLNILLDMVAA